jgi:integrase
VKRYANSFDKFRVLGPLRADATLSSLRGVDWSALTKTWPGSGSDWNHLRRAVSRFLTCHLKDEYHPLRREVVNAIPLKAEVERVPDLDPATFWRVVEAAPDYLRASYVAIVALGLRMSEFLRMREEHLHPLTKSVSVPGTKTAGSLAVLKVDPELWSWVVRAVPCPVTESPLRRAWKRALASVGADRSLRVHDLRHLTAQWLTEAGRSEASVMGMMRHRSASMTRRYARQKDHGENAATLAKVLLEARSA